MAPSITSNAWIVRGPQLWPLRTYLLTVSIHVFWGPVINLSTYLHLVIASWGADPQCTWRLEFVEADHGIAERQRGRVLLVSCVIEQAGDFLYKAPRALSI